MGFRKKKTKQGHTITLALKMFYEELKLQFVIVNQVNQTRFEKYP